MKSIRYCAYILILLGTFMLQACGSGGAGSDTNGTLSMTDLTVTDQTGGFYLVRGSATYTPPAGKVPNGAQISFVAQIRAASSTTPTTLNDTRTLDSTGVAGFFFTVPQASEPKFVTVTASIGDLSVSNIATVPAISLLNVTPSVLSFALTDVAGTNKTLTISGGISPYTVTSDKAADITVTLNGADVTATLVNAPGATQKSATVTVKDLNGTSVNIPVTYF